MSLNGRARDITFVKIGRSRPGWRVLFLWLKQGRPRDFPVIVERGILRGQLDPGRGVVHSIVADSWHLDGSFLSSGVMIGDAVIEGLCRRYPVEVTYPDGTIREMDVPAAPAPKGTS